MSRSAPLWRRVGKDIEAGKVDCIVVYKVDRLSRSLLDSTRIMKTLEKREVSFVCRAGRSPCVRERSRKHQVPKHDGKVTA